MEDRYKYLIKNDPKKRELKTEEELKKLNPNFCSPGEHNWKTTFVFGLYECRNCDALKKVK